MRDLWDKISTGLAVTLVILLLFVMGSGLWAVRSLFPLLGMGFVFDLIVIIAALPFALAAGAWVLWTRRGRHLPIEQYGSYLQQGRKLIPLPPLLPATPKVAGATNVTEVKPDIPRLGELIRDNLLVKEAEEGTAPLMLQGFRADGTPRYGTWPGVIGVAGMQNVGKSVTIETLAIIALMQLAHVVVCDTHYMKARSLYKKLQCLEGYITFAKSEQEVAREARKFSQELQRRKGGSEIYPYIFILDEAASIVRSPVGDGIVTTIEEASQEGHGFSMHLVLAIHDFSKDGLGDARIRDFLNWIYCHRMQAGQSKFIEAFNVRKTKAAIAALPAGHTIAKDEVNDIEYLILPFADSKDALAARKVIEQLRPLAQPYQPRRSEERRVGKECRSRWSPYH